MRRGFLGVSIEDLNAEYAEAFQVPEAQGAFVQSVGEGLPAEVAGLRGGDVIVAVDGREVRGARDFRMKIAEFAPGETVALSVRREGDLLQMKVKLADPEQPYSYNSHSHGLTWMLLLRHHQPFHASAPSTHPS